MSLSLLPNIVWHTLTGPHARFASGTDSARRYAKGFSPIVAFRDAQRPDFAALEPYCDADEHFYCAGWSGPVPAGWRLDTDARMHQMLWDADAPSPDPQPPVRLRAEHVPQMVALATLTKPGPFAQRTPELGDYFAYFEGDRLAAMAGERMAAGALREVSGVCTHPDFQGRGYGRRLVAHVVRVELGRGEQPFLHVMVDNANAARLYASMGFRHHNELPVRVVTREK